MFVHCTSSKQEKYDKTYDAHDVEWKFW